MRRSRLNPISAKRHAVNIERRKMLVTAFGPRDTWECSVGHVALWRGVMGTCLGPINGHEIVKRSQGGSIVDPENIVLLCDYHNGWVERFPEAAHRLGLTRSAWEEA